MRSFIAIELPKDIRENLHAIQKQLRLTGADVKWVQPENIHLTLKFLGEINEELLNKITNILDDIGKENKAYPIRVNSLGAFPRLSSPRVVWVGIDQGNEETQKIAQGLEERIALLGIPKEDRPFSTHITIGRTKSSLNLDKLVKELNNIKEGVFQKNPEFQAGKITLFKSSLTPKGPLYEVLHEANLTTI